MSGPFPRMLWRAPDDPLAGKRLRLLRTEAERRAFELEVGPEGRLLWGGRPLTSAEARSFRVVCNALGEDEEGAIFVMSEAGTIYMADQAAEIDQRLHFHHTSFLAGGSVAAAGVFRFGGDGALARLTEISDLSGHYQPTARHTWQLVSELAARGVDLGGVWVVGWHFRPPIEARFLLENPTIFGVSTGH